MEGKLLFSDLPVWLHMCVIHIIQPCAPELNRSPWIYSGCHSRLLSSLCPLLFCGIYLPMDCTTHTPPGPSLPGPPPPCWPSVPEISSNVCSLHYSWPQFSHQSLSKTSPKLVLTLLLQLSVWCVSHPIICPMSMTDTWREKLRVSVSPVHWVSCSVCLSLSLSFLWDPKPFLVQSEMLFCLLKVWVEINSIVACSNADI